MDPLGGVLRSPRTPLVGLLLMVSVTAVADDIFKKVTSGVCEQQLTEEQCRVYMRTGTAGTVTVVSWANRTAGCTEESQASGIYNTLPSDMSCSDSAPCICFNKHRNSTLSPTGVTPGPSRVVSHSPCYHDADHCHPGCTNPRDQLVVGEVYRANFVCYLVQREGCTFSCLEKPSFYPKYLTPTESCAEDACQDSDPVCDAECMARKQLASRAVETNSACFSKPLCNNSKCYYLAKSPQECSTACDSVQGCTIFSLNPSRGVCYLYDSCDLVHHPLFDTYIPMVPNDEAAKYYVLIGISSVVIVLSGCAVFYLIRRYRTARLRTRHALRSVTTQESNGIEWMSLNSHSAHQATVVYVESLLPSNKGGDPAPSHLSTQSSSSNGTLVELKKRQPRNTVKNTGPITGGKALGGWQKGQLLGRGSYGEVFMGVLSTGELIAVKIVGTTVGSKEAAALEKEVELMKPLSHPNLVAYLGVEVDEPTSSVVLLMEFVEGGSLAALARRSPVPLDEEVVRLYIRQVTSALSYLHRNGVLHRDVKGDNILLTKSGKVKLADFGCSRRMGDMASAGGANYTMVGTPYWMAPEVITCGSGSAAYGPAADVWSLGCTVVELLNKGAPPWPQHPTMWAAMYHIANTTGPPTEIPDGLTPDALDFLNVIFQRDPRARPTTEDLLAHSFLAPKDPNADPAS